MADHMHVRDPHMQVAARHCRLRMPLFYDVCCAFNIVTVGFVYYAKKIPKPYLMCQSFFAGVSCHVSTLNQHITYLGIVDVEASVLGSLLSSIIAKMYRANCYLTGELI